MAHENKNGLWVADDGSWGVGKLVIVDRTNWSEQQEDWLVEITFSSEPTIEDVVSIDKNIQPPSLSYEPEL